MLWCTPWRNLVMPFRLKGTATLLLSFIPTDQNEGTYCTSSVCAKRTNNESRQSTRGKHYRKEGERVRAKAIWYKYILPGWCKGNGSFECRVFACEFRPLATASRHTNTFLLVLDFLSCFGMQAVPKSCGFSVTRGYWTGREIFFKVSLIRSIDWKTAGVCRTTQTGGIAE